MGLQVRPISANVNTQKLRKNILENTQKLRVDVVIFAYCGILVIEVIKMTLRDLRKQKDLTQIECAKYLGMPVRTYQNYETDESKARSMKYEFMIQKLEQYGYVDETHGVLSLQQIKDVCADVFSNFEIEYCYLFGSYAKGKAEEHSDVDLLIATPVSGIKFYDLIEAIREGLKKRVDVLNREQLNDNPELINEILKDGIKIYG